MHILDLPENVLLNLFLYFEDNEVYSTLRLVCRRFRICSNSYIKLEAKFLLIRNTFQSYASSWILYFFKKNHAVTPFYSKSTIPPKMWKFDKNSNYMDSFPDGLNSTTFGMEIGDQIVAGTYSISASRPKQCIKQYFCYEYKRETKEWNRLSVNNKEIQTTQRGIILTKCTIGNSDLVFFKHGLHILELAEEDIPAKRTNFIHSLFQNVKRQPSSQTFNVRSIGYLSPGIFSMLFNIPQLFQ